jgi:hypothetical protein
VRPQSIPGKDRSSAYRAAPVAFPIPSFLFTLRPTALTRLTCVVAREGEDM